MPLAEISVSHITVVHSSAPKRHKAAAGIVPLRQVMIDAAKNAVKQMPQTTKAAKALGIQHERLKQLLREGGDATDRRKMGKDGKG